MMGPILSGALPRMKFDADTNIICDGNSLTAGVGGFAWPNGLKTREGFTTCTIAQFAVSGQTTLQMSSNAADIDGAWKDGKRNVLVVWEGTNSICNANPFRSAALAAGDMQAYIAARLALHPWIVLVGTCLPRQTAMGQTQTTDQNTILDAYNALVRANYRAWGAKGLFDVRQAGSAFNVSDYQMASFETMADSTGYWASGETNNHIHLSSPGYHHLIDNFIVPALKRLPAR